MKPIPVLVLILCAVLTGGRAETWRVSETLWQDAVSVSPMRPRPHINLGSAYMAQGRYESALREYQLAEVLSLRPETPPHERDMARLLTAMNIADIFVKLGRIEEAHQILKQGWIVEPGFPGYAVNLSWFYLRNREPEKAIPFLVDGIQHFGDYDWFPKKGSLYVNLGVALQMIGRCDQAREAYALARQYPERFEELPCI